MKRTFLLILLWLYNIDVFFNLHVDTQNADNEVHSPWAGSTPKDTTREKSPARPSPGKLKNLSMFESNNDTDFSKSTREKSPFRASSEEKQQAGFKNKLHMFEAKKEESNTSFGSPSSRLRKDEVINSSVSRQTKPLSAYQSDFNKREQQNSPHQHSPLPSQQQSDVTHKSMTSRTIRSGYRDNFHEDNVSWKEKLKDSSERNAREVIKTTMSSEEPKVEFRILDWLWLYWGLGCSK